MTAISIVMPCHNRDHDLYRVLAAYDQQTTTASFELIAVDDASTDSTFDLLSSYQAQKYTLRVERLELNQGPAAARNRGISLARSPLVLFVGDDILPQRYFVQGHVDAHHKQPSVEVAILGRVRWACDLPQNTLMAHIDGEGAEQFSYFYMHDGHEYDYRHLYTSNVSLKTEFLRLLDHWFDSDFRYAAFEDAELAYRLSQHGLRIKYSAETVGEHYHYHTVWSFSTRQYYCGQMAWVLMRKHPPSIYRLLGRRFAHTLSSAIRFNRSLCSEEIESAESKVLRLASYYEWHQNPLVQTLYSKLLVYFFDKGFIQAMFADSMMGRRIQGSHARQSLGPLLQWFSSAATRTGILMPEGYEQVHVV